MISSNDLRPGVTIEYREGVWQVIEALHVKPGKDSAFVQTKLRNVQTSDVLKVTFRAGERLPAANLEKSAAGVSLDEAQALSVALVIEARIRTISVEQNAKLLKRHARTKGGS